MIVEDQIIEECASDDAVVRAINEMEDYHASTCGDKYGAAVMDTMSLIMNDEHGKSINIFNAFKYLSRYITSGYEKSDNRKDVIKAVHYLLFELARTEGQTEITPSENNGLWSFDQGDWVYTPEVGTIIYPPDVTLMGNSNHVIAADPVK